MHHDSEDGRPYTKVRREKRQPFFTLFLEDISLARCGGLEDEVIGGVAVDRSDLDHFQVGRVLFDLK